MQRTAAPRVPGRGSLLLGARRIARLITQRLGRSTRDAGVTGLSTLLVLSLFVVSFAPILDLVPWIRPPYDQKRAAELVVIVLSLALAAAHPRGLHRVPRLALYSILALAALGAVSAGFAPSPRHAASEVALFGGLLFLTLNLASIYEKRRETALFLTGYMLNLGTFMLLVAFLAGCAAALVHARPLSASEIVPGFSNIRFLNQTQTWSIPLLALCVFVRGTPSRILVASSCVVLSGSWFMLFATGARGSLLALAVACVLSLWVFGRAAARPFLKVQALCVATGFLAKLFVFELAPRWIGIGDSLLFDLGRTSDTGRVALWQQAATLIAENPLLGVGPQHFARYENAFSLAHPHNAPLQIASEWGLPAALVVAGLLLWGFVRWTAGARARHGNSSQASVSVILWTAMVAGATHSLLAGIVVMPLSQLLMTVICGAALGTYEPRLSNRSEHTANTQSSLRLASALVLVFLVAAVAPDLVVRVMGEELMPTGMVVVGPRFWQLGGIPH